MPVPPRQLQPDPQHGAEASPTDLRVSPALAPRSPAMCRIVLSRGRTRKQNLWAQRG